MVGILLGFGGGVLFSTTFLHLIPEVREGVEALVEDGRMPQLNFSLADIPLKYDESHSDFQSIHFLSNQFYLMPRAD